METPPGADQLDLEIFEAMGKLIAALITRGEQIARRFGVPAFCLKALHALGAPMAMRDLAGQMHCDPSFVTSVADHLEKRGLARREASVADRRIKNIVLTPEGMRAREQLLGEFVARMPWRCLSDTERASLLALVRKMIRTEAGATSAAAPPAPGEGRAGEVSEEPAAAGSPVAP